MKKIALLALFFTMDSYAACQLVNDVFVCNNSNTYLQQLAAPPPDFSSKIVPRENIQLLDAHQ